MVWDGDGLDSPIDELEERADVAVGMRGMAQLMRDSQAGKEGVTRERSDVLVAERCHGIAFCLNPFSELCRQLWNAAR